MLHPVMRETSSHLTAPLASSETRGRSVGSEETAAKVFNLFYTQLTTPASLRMSPFSIRSAVFHHFDKFISMIQMSGSLLF